MKLKLDENGHVVLKDGFPVWVADDGTEIAYNVPDLVNKISAVNGESAGRRKEIDALTAKLKEFEGIDPEKAKAAFVAQGHRASTIKHLALYVKPEEQKAYYVINGKESGSVDL
mgnify:CR=1 FL=1